MSSYVGLMTTEKKIHFDNARETQAVIGQRYGMVAKIEKAFGVRLTSRDDWVELAGEAEAVARADDFLETMRRAHASGVFLQAHELRYALRAYERGREDELRSMAEGRIDVDKGKPAVFPRTFGQQRYLQAIRTDDLVFGIGPAGTGKTYLAMAMAVSALLKDSVSRIILTRPAIEAGEELGFLPGDMQAKVMPYLRPLYDALYDMMHAEQVERALERGVIEVAPLAYMRGRTLNHSFVILDEAQNTTEEQMFMFLTRMGFDSKCVVTGDLTQIDLPASKRSGLKEASGMLARIEGVSISYLDESDVVRHELVRRIINAYKRGRNQD
jgi:phosphate starvation-inducible protein PhoH and related proteins